MHDLLKPEKGLSQQNTGGRRLVWFRTLAFQANDPGFKSRRPHQNSGSNPSELATTNIFQLIYAEYFLWNDVLGIFSDTICVDDS